MYNMSILGTAMSIWRGKNAEHYFLMCTFYRNKRVELIYIVSQFCRVIIVCLLRGNNDLSYQTNVHIFEAVQSYIKNGKSFYDRSSGAVA